MRARICWPEGSRLADCRSPVHFPGIRDSCAPRDQIISRLELPGSCLAAYSRLHPERPDSGQRLLEGLSDGLSARRQRASWRGGGVHPSRSDCRNRSILLDETVIGSSQPRHDVTSSDCLRRPESKTSLLRYTGSHTENPTLDLPCREVFARGQKQIAVAGPLLEDEAGRVHEGFWTS